MNRLSICILTATCSALLFSVKAQVEIIFDGNVVSSGSSNAYTVSSFSQTQVLDIRFKNLSQETKHYTVSRTRLINPASWTHIKVEFGSLTGVGLCYAGNQDYTWSTPAAAIIAPGEIALYRDSYDVSNDSCAHYRYYLISQEAGVEDSLDILGCSIVGLEETSRPEFTVYPNPAKGTFLISASIPFDRVELFNTQGQLVFSEIIGGTSTEISCAPCGEGNYFLQLNTAQGPIGKRVQVIREE